jgi:hypothetical protein
MQVKSLARIKCVSNVSSLALSHPVLPSHYPNIALRLHTAASGVTPVGLP